MNKTYDIVIIGSGPGGYAASIKAAGLGLKACVIEKELIGGTCLNWGCIPTKTIVRSTGLLYDIRQAEGLGIKCKSCDVDFSRILDRKEGVVNTLRLGAESLLRQKRIDIIRSEAIFTGPNTVQAGDDIIESRNIIIATGSRPSEPYPLGIDHENILSSRDMLSLKGLPKSIVIIGGGFIGCEFASIYNLLGVDVTIVEVEDQLIPGIDKEIAKRLELVFTSNGVKILKKDKVVSVDKGANVSVKTTQGRVIDCEKVLLSVGRRPNIEGLGLDTAGVDIEKGFVRVDNNLRTSAPHIYAIGDVIAGYPLAHVATYEGVLAVDNITGNNRQADYRAVPSAIFTHPEIAITGLNIDRAREYSADARETRLPFAAVSKSHVYGRTDGFIKLIFAQGTRKILGAAIFGSFASEIISNFTIAISTGLTIDDISRTIFAHPTFSESVFDTVNRALI
jgi:dihydrolipoamide dehydrogenase